MSEATQEREVELVSGTIEGVTLKREGTWQVSVKPEGSQYAKNLWTKSESTVRALEAKIGQHVAFVCHASYWKRQDGQEVRSLWISEEADAQTVASAPVSDSPPIRQHGPGTTSRTYQMPKTEMTKEEWARKDSAIHKMACIKAAADALKHTIPENALTEDLNLFNMHVLHLANAWHKSVIAERDDPTGESVPF